MSLLAEVNLMLRCIGLHYFTNIYTRFGIFNLVRCKSKLIIELIEQFIYISIHILSNINEVFNNQLAKFATNLIRMISFLLF